MRHGTVLTLLALACCVFTASAEPVENILMITYDGLRWQEVFGGADARLLPPAVEPSESLLDVQKKYWADTPETRRERLLPFLWNVMVKEGQLIGDAEKNSVVEVTNKRNFSYPGYNELLSGAADERIDSNAKLNNPNVTVLEWLNEKPEYRDRVAAFGSWDVFPYIINGQRSGLPISAGWEGAIESHDRELEALLQSMSDETPHYWQGVRFDVFTYHAAVEYITKHKPRVIYIAFGETDDWAHDGRYDMYLESARRTDDYIQRIWELLQSMRQYRDKTALILSTDHGRGDDTESWKSHGEELSESSRIWMAALGPGIPAKGVVENMNATQSQYAPTAAALLGEDFQASKPGIARPLELNH